MWEDMEVALINKTAKRSLPSSLQVYEDAQTIYISELC